MASPVGYGQLRGHKAKVRATDRARRPVTSTHEIRITADDFNWLTQQLRPGEKYASTFHRLRMMLAYLENEKDKSNSTDNQSSNHLI